MGEQIWTDEDILEVEVAGRRVFMSGLAARLALFPVVVIRVVEENADG